MNSRMFFFKYFFLILFTVTLISFFIMLFIESKTIKAKADEIRKEEKLFIFMMMNHCVNIKRGTFAETWD